MIATATVPSASWAASPPKPRPVDRALASLRERVGAKKVPIEDPCVEPDGAGQGCRRRALGRVVSKLRDARAGKGQVRILHLGDSHIASDYITSTIRDALQSRFGDPGRGFTVIDQPYGFGGRLIPRGTRGWEKDRIVDKDRAGRPFGFSGVSLESAGATAQASFALLGDETRVRLYYQARPNAGKVRAYAGKDELGTLDTSGTDRSAVHTFEITRDGRDRSVKTSAKAAGGSPARRELRLVAQGPPVRLYGISFESDRAGVYYDAIGPLGADAKVYLDLDPTSFKQHLEAHSPDLIVLMVGGNDAMKARKGWTDLAKVRADHENLIDLLRGTLPSADCLVWAPMDAGDKAGGKVVSRALLQEVREMQRAVALEKGCGFWDLLESMGGAGSIVRWHAAKVMNDDLVHPREKAAALLGSLFVESWDAL